MAKLILSLDAQVLKEHDINKERTTIGRKPHNDIQIDNLAVSGEHAMIMTILNDSFLEDLGSTNGTLVNGQPIKKHFLQSNDIIEIGKYRIKYLNEKPAKMTAQEFEKTMVLRNPPASTPAAKPKGASDTHTDIQAAKPAEMPPPVPQSQDTAAIAQTIQTPKFDATASQPGSAPQPATVPQPGPAVPQTAPGAAASAGAQGMIQILSGPNAGKELPLTKPLTTVGKPGVQVAVIAKRPLGYYITHVEGATFPIVNGRPLDAQAHQLNDHDVIELAGVKMEFFFRA
jgi:pSer/pThr/pTyr-binding forkhead associated (FHA) protein